MLSKHLLGAATATMFALIPASAWAQGTDANTTTAATNSANAAPTTAPANLVMGNSAVGGAAAPAAADAAASGDTNAPHPVYMVQRGFPWGILGVIGLIGLLPLFRRRDG
jgi:hypothetical protein